MSRPATAPWKARADRLRALPLERVARRLGYSRDPRNRLRWKRRGSVLSISAARFYDHCAARGGGGAIDLVLHIRQGSFRDALDFLDTLPASRQAPAPAPQPAQAPGLRLPEPRDERWPAVRRYLARSRRICTRLLDRCHRRGLLWADQRRNAVFLCRDRQHRPAGAELAGTRPDPSGRTFKGLAKGSRKQRGGFWLPPPDAAPSCVLLTESAVDALSARLLSRHLPADTLVASTAGVARRLPAWLSEFPASAILCGYDADAAGEHAADALQECHPGLRRLRPPDAADWNDLLLQAKA